MKKSLILLAVVALFGVTTACVTLKTAEEYIDRAETYFAKRNYDRAIADLDQAIQLNLDFANPYWHRAFAYLKKGNYIQAHADVNKASTAQR